MALPPTKASVVGQVSFNCPSCDDRSRSNGLPFRERERESIGTHTGREQPVISLVIGIDPGPRLKRATNDKHLLRMPVISFDIQAKSVLVHPAS